MEIRIVAVGSRPPAWATDAVRSYLSKTGLLRIDFADIRPDRTKNALQARRREAERIAQRIGDRAGIVALDERGEQPDTVGLADMVRALHASHGRTAFVIGGADGLAPELRERSDRLLSLSRLTLPHALAKVLLVEQLYRVDAILRGHPYHRGGGG